MARRRREKVELTGDEEQLVSFRLGKEMFAVNVSQVREIGKVQDITRIPKMPSYVEGVLNLRGQITMVIDLKRRLNIATEGCGASTKSSRIIIAEIGDTQVGIVVDAVEDVMRVPRSSISPPPKNLTVGSDSGYLTGICMLSDRLVMLLDLTLVMNVGGMERINGMRADKEASVGT